MIGRLRGILVGIDRETVLVDVGGVGYHVTMTPAGVGALPTIGEEVVVHTHLQVREDDMSLYGFPSATDRDLFRIVISAGGIGPKVGLSLLATLRSDQLRRAVATEDVDSLATAPGVGRRSAQKMILELRPKLAEAEAEVVGGSGPGRVHQALTNLGYSDEEISGIIPDLDHEASLTDQIKTALKTLGQARRA